MITVRKDKFTVAAQTCPA